VRRAILEKNVRVAEGDEIGYDLVSDRLRERCTVTESGIVVVGGRRSQVEVATVLV
jgi:glucose-1-phosphate adenylyltransferase